jgi:hypothetical protein
LGRVADQRCLLFLHLVDISMIDTALKYANFILDVVLIVGFICGIGYFLSWWFYP